MVQNIADNASAITDLDGRIDTLEAIDHSVYAKTADVNTALAGKVDVEEGKRLMDADEGTKLAGIEAGAEVNVIDAVEATEFTVGETDRKLSILAVAQSKVTGLTDALAAKVDKVDGSRLITNSEAEKLEKLVLGEDGEVSVSGTIAAGNVDGLAEWITTHRGDTNGLYPSADATKLAGIENGAEVNVIEAITIGGNTVATSNKTLDIPIATAEVLGVVKGATGENNIAVDAEGVMSVNSLNVNKLVQTAGEWLVLNGGNAALTTSANE